MFKGTNIFIYVCNIIDTWRCTCIFVLNLVYMKYMQQRSSPVRLYVNMKYCRVLDSQKQLPFFFCLLSELAELLQTFFGMFDRSVSWVTWQLVWHRSSRMTWLCWQLFGFYSYAIYSQYIKYLPKNRCIVNIFVQLYVYWPSCCSPILSYSPLL